MWGSNFIFPHVIIQLTSTICCKDYSFPVIWSWRRCWKSVDHRFVGAFLKCAFRSFGLYGCLCASTTLSSLLVLYCTFWNWEEWVLLLCFSWLRLSCVSISFWPNDWSLLKTEAIESGTFCNSVMTISVWFTLPRADGPGQCHMHVRGHNHGSDISPLLLLIFYWLGTTK